jgi:ATP-dependent exoDNAse (exonuclease V) beta subunit
MTQAVLLICRLMYVAITRARQRLYLSHSQTRMLHVSQPLQPEKSVLNELRIRIKWITLPKKIRDLFPELCIKQLG